MMELKKSQGESNEELSGKIQRLEKLLETLNSSQSRITQEIS
jgi:chaperonin cofactor prefoldin